MSPTLPGRAPSASPIQRFVRLLLLTALAAFFVNFLLPADGPARAAAPDPSDPNCCFYKVQGTVWYDQNGDGIKQGTEPPLPGWTVQALDNANNVVGTTTTNGAGLYNFDVPVGCGSIFKMKSVVQSGWTQTFPPSNGVHSGTGTGCTEIPLGPYNFGNNQPACGPFTKTYTLDGDFNMGTLNGVVTNVNQLELASTPTTWPFAWIANSADGTISKVDTNTGKEVGRYYTGPPDINNMYTGLAPSRTVVDANGNCWVANRNYGGNGPASVTQIALTGGIDWNANSVINTSQDWNNNGIIDPAELLPWGQDERVIRHYQVGAVAEQARGMTLDKTGGLWIGLSNAYTVIKVNPNLSTATYNASQPPSAPPVLITIPVGYLPYGLALSPNGKIYMSTGGDRAFQIDPGLASGGTGAGPAVTENIYHPNAYNYGICVDRNCIVWFALTYIQAGYYGCMRWDPSLTLGNPANGWTISQPGAAGPGRGICADFNNNIWMACNDANNSVCKFNNLPIPTVVNNYLTNSVVPIGIGAGSDGNMIVTPGGNSLWTKINSSTGAIMPLVGPQTVGNFPYTYSDFTGAQVGISGIQQGTWNVITDAGTSAHAWNFIGWNQSTPAGTSVLVEARVAQNLVVLATKPWNIIGVPGPQTPMSGRHIETRVRLQRAVEGCSPPFVTPILYDLTVAAICDPCGFANCPSDTTIPCTSPQGAEFFYMPPILSAICDSTWNVTCFPNSGFFPVGTTAVTCTAINAKDETVTCTFNVTVTGGCDHPPEGACCYRGNCYMTDQASCEAVGGVYMGDNTNCALNICRQDCVVPPNNLAAWWPLNSSVGSVTPNLAGPLTGGTLINAPTVVSGQKVQNAYSFNGTNQYINVPHNTTLDLGGGDFSFDCWIKTSQSNGVATIFDKRSSGSIQGTAFFLFSGYPSLQMAVANNFSNYILTNANGGTAAFVADGNWHFVAVTVDRDDPAGIQFYVDGAAVGTPFNPVPRSGSLNNTLALLIAQRYPALGGGFLNGSLDEIEIIRRELSASEVSDLFMADVAGKCPETCYATQNATCCNGYSSSSAVTICNYSLTAQTYSFGLTPLNGGPGCGPIGANGFSPASATVTVPAQSCVTTPVYIACPSQLPPGQSACYSVSVFNHNTGRFFGCTGSVRKVGKWCWKDVPVDATPVGGIHMIPSGSARVVQLMVGNMGPANPGLPPETINYMIQPVRGDNGETSRGISLNGLPPGEPVLGTLSLHGGQSDMFSIDVAYPDESLIGYDRLVIWGDDDGDGADERLGEVAVRNISLATSAVPDDPGPVTGPPADGARLLLAFPNPFGASDAIRFRVDDGAPVREVKLRLYDLQGRLVKAFILEEFMTPGEYTVNWDTHDNRGEALRAGIYFLKLSVDEKSESVKIMIRR